MRVAWLLLLALFAVLHDPAQAQSVSLAWDAPTPIPAGMAITGYQLQRCLVPSGQPTCVPQDLPGVTTTVLSLIDTPPSPGTYQYAVVALCAQCTGGRSVPSNVLTVTVDMPPSPSPSGVRADVLLPISRLVASADSEETVKEQDLATRVLDGQPLTLWHSQWSQTPLLPLPHWLQIDVQDSLWWTGGMTVLPRQDTLVNPLGGNGTIKDYRIEGSSDGVTWMVLASGTWLPGRQAQTVRWPPFLTQALKLTVLSNQQNQCCWASVAEISVLGALQP